MIPNLIHPLPIRIERKENAITVFDPVAREPVRRVWRNDSGPGTGTGIDLVAQVNWNIGEIAKPTFNPAGVEEKYTGYILFRVVDLLAASVATETPDGILTVALARGDRLVRVGRRATNLYLVFFRDVAGYPDQGGSTLLEVRFNDRAPAA